MLRHLALVLLFCCVGPIAAQSSVAPAPLPAESIKLIQHVTDLTGTLTTDQITQLETQLVELEKRKGSQVAVYMISSLGDQSLEDYSLAIAEKNKLGRAKTDDGVLLFIAKDDRKVRIEVGYGLEGAIPDAKAGRIIREYLAPNFRKGDYNQGIVDATGAIILLINGEQLPAPLHEEPGKSPVNFFALIIGVFVGIMAAGTKMKPAFLRRSGAGLVAGLLAFIFFSTIGSVALAGIVAFLFSSSGPGRFSSGGGSWGSFPGGGGGGGGWSGGGGGFGGGGASGGW